MALAWELNLFAWVSCFSTHASCQVLYSMDETWAFMQSAQVPSSMLKTWLICMGVQGTLSFGFESYWLARWYKFLD